MCAIYIYFFRILFLGTEMRYQKIVYVPKEIYYVS